MTDLQQRGGAMPSEVFTGTVEISGTVILIERWGRPACASSWYLEIPPLRLPQPSLSVLTPPHTRLSNDLPLTTSSSSSLNSSYSSNNVSSSSIKAISSSSPAVRRKYSQYILLPNAFQQRLLRLDIEAGTMIHRAKPVVTLTYQMVMKHSMKMMSTAAVRMSWMRWTDMALSSGDGRCVVYGRGFGEASVS
jgi:hypothetical protein